MTDDTSLWRFLRRHPSFARFFLGMFFVQVGHQIQAAALLWQVYEIARLTMSIKDALYMVGVIGLAQFLPLFLLTLFAGTVADRRDRKLIVLATLALEFCAALGLTLLSAGETPSLLPIFVIAALLGVARAYISPAATALTPMLVPRPEMPRAISLKSLSWQAAVIGGPVIGGVLVTISPVVAYGTVAGLFLTGFVVLTGIRGNTRPVRQPGKTFAQIGEGLAYVWGNKIILGAISLDLFAVLLGGATALLPAFAKDVLGIEGAGYGVLRAAPAVGAALMAIYLAKRPVMRRAGLKMFWAVAGFGLATIVFAVSTNVYLSIAALAALGAADMVSVFVRQTLVQIVTPDHMRGRVASVSGLFISGSNELGEFESGFVASYLGPVGAAVFGGVGTLVVTGLWAWTFPALRRTDRLDGDPG